MSFDPSRRNTLQKIALGAGGLLLTSASASAFQTGPARKLGVALVGLGNYSSAQLAPALL
ncbi:MAG: hypothetical protein ICV83_05520, partial [Cytophagales bacterium]|nr:hypothetical protein [Cytophagales bacterium]